MAGSEAALLRSLLLTTSRLGARLFRNQTGRYRLAQPDCPRCQADGRMIASGLCVGSPDLIGWVPVTITSDMVGRQLAVFVGLEVKRPTGGRVTKEQAAFVQALAQAGGVAAVVRSCVEAHHALWQVHGVVPVDCVVTPPDDRV